MNQSSKAIVAGCYDNLTNALSMPMACVPTAVNRFVNLQAPFSKKDIALLTNTPLNLFVADPDKTNDPRFGGSQSLTENSLKLIGHHLIYGLCLVLYPDVSGYTAEGNLFTPQSAFGVNSLPASPYVVRNAAAILTRFGGAAMSPAAMEKGHPSWDAMTAFLRAFRMKVYCPDDNNVILVDEQCSNLGSCCAVMDLEGLGATNKDTSLDVRRLNERLVAINTGDLRPDGIADTGYFVPCNANQLADDDIVPDRPESPISAYARPMGVPGYEFFHAFPCPLPVGPETLLKIELRSDDGDSIYLQDFLDLLTMAIAQDVYPDSGPTFPTVESGVAGTALGRKTRIPFTRIRVGIALKALKVAQCVCNQMQKKIEEGAVEPMTQTRNVLSKICSGPACSPCG